MLLCNMFAKGLNSTSLIEREANVYDAVEQKEQKEQGKKERDRDGIVEEKREKEDTVEQKAQDQSPGSV